MSTECGGKLMPEPRSLCSTPGVERATCLRSMKHPQKQNQLPRGTATMLNSVRIRLTLWYTAAMTLVLVVLAAATYFVLRQNVVRRADANATELADSFLSTVNAELGDASRPDSVDEGIAAAISEHRFRDVIFLVFDPQGNLLGVSDTYRLPGRPEGPTRESIAASLRPLVTAPDTFRSVRVGEHQYRSYVRHFSVDQQAATLFVLQSLHRQNEFLETLAGTFWIVIPLAILFAGVGGYLLARRSLSPVVVMGAQASRIGSENLYERLQVQNPRDELGQLAGSFNELLDRLNQSFDRQRRFVADASHELRTPVAILCGEAEVTLAQEKRSEQEYRESLRILGDEAKRLKHIVEDLFTLLRRMILNLLDNAIKYTPDGGCVTVICRRAADEYVLSIADTGGGIPADLQPRSFDRFFRVDKARSRAENDGGGAGLGLSISRWI